MKLQNIGNYKTINKFVASKLDRFDSMEKNYESLFQLMFSEKTNTLFEKSDGYKVIKTTYGQCYDSILKKAATLYSLLKLNTTSDDTCPVVGLYMDNCLEWIENLWAIILCGCNPLLINMRLDTQTIENVLDRCDVKAVISDSKEFSKKTIKALDITEAASAFTPSVYGTEILVMTSGTTFNVKVCAYTALEFSYQVKDSYKIIQQAKLMKKHYDGELKQLTFLPFYHIFGLAAVYIWFAFFSRTFVQLNDMAPQTIVNTIRKHKVTHIFAVPMFWEKVYEQALKTIKERGEETYSKFQKGLKLARIPVLGKLITKYAFKEVRDNLFGESICFMIAGGSYIPKETLEFFNLIGYHLADGYGMSEVGITSVELSNNVKLLSSGSIGKPLSSIEYKIESDGELFIKGKGLAHYVWDEKGKHYNTGDWFKTNDLAKEINGNYYILGRKDDLIISLSGENLNPNIVEPKFVINGIKAVCLIGVNSEKGPVPVLLISVNKFITKEKLIKLSDAVKNRINEVNLSGQIAKIVFITDNFITGEEFKLNRTRIKRDYKDGKLNIITPENAIEQSDQNESPVAPKVRQFFAIALNKKPEDIAYTSDFFLDEGGTSLDYFAMTSQLQQEFEISFPADLEKSMNTIKDLCEFIEKQL